MDAWLTRKAAAAWLDVCPDTITAIVHEMEAKGLEGIYRRGGVLRINKKEMSNYLKVRKELKKHER